MADLTLPARALLFDMDGTLVDSTGVVETAWRRLAERFGLDAEELLRSIHGVRAEDSIRRFAPPGSDIEALVAELTDFEIRSAAGTVPLPGAVEFLNALPLEVHALVTSASLPLAVARMKGAGVRMPQFVVTAEDVARGKPAPDVYLLAAEILGVDQADAVVFEDAEAGVQAALAAGMRVIVVGDHVSPSAPDLPRIPDYRHVAVQHDARGFASVTIPGNG